MNSVGRWCSAAQTIRSKRNARNTRSRLRGSTALPGSEYRGQNCWNEGWRLNEDEIDLPPSQNTKADRETVQPVARSVERNVACLLPENELAQKSGVCLRSRMGCLRRSVAVSGINIVVGPPGAGKGLWLIQVVRDILLDTNQTIVSNFAVKLAELNIWFQKNYPDTAINLHERIRFLELEEIKRFYLIRGNGKDIHGVSKEDEKRNIFPDYDPCKQWPPVCYILDEADIHFGAREYADHGRSVNFYNKQHRKLSDSVYYCCQSAEQLDKQIRLLSQQTIVLKNLGKQRKGIFALPQVFCWSAYYQVPKQNTAPMASGVFRLRLDHGLQDCFETAAGVGLAGMKADRDEKRNGVSLLWAIPAMILVGILLIKAPMLLAKGISGSTIGAAKVVAESYKLSETVQGESNKAQDLFGQADPHFASTNPIASNQFQHPVSSSPDSMTNTNEVYLTGISKFGNKVVVYLSNGDVYTNDDRELKFVSKRKVIINGSSYGFRPFSYSDAERGPNRRIPGLLF